MIICLFDFSGLVNGFLCCSMRHRHNSYSSSSASSPNIELQNYAEPRPLGCKTDNQRNGIENQPLRNYFVNSISVSPKDSRTVEAQLAPYNWPNNQSERNSLTRNASFLVGKSSEYSSMTDSKPSSSITVIPPQGGNWNAVLSNPNYSQHVTICEDQSKGPDLVRNMMQHDGTNSTHKDQMTKRSTWMSSFPDDAERKEGNSYSDSKIRISSPSMSTSNASSAEGLGSSVMSSGSSTSNPSSLSQSTGNFAKHKVLIEGRSDSSSSSSTSSSSSLSSSSGTADFTPSNNFHLETIVGGGFNSSNNRETRKISMNKDTTYHEKTHVPYIIDEDNINDNSKPSQERFAAYYWNGNNDDNEIYSSNLHHEVKTKRNSGMMMPSAMIKEDQRNPNYSSPAAPPASAQQNNLHNLTMNANFMRPIHI